VHVWDLEKQRIERSIEKHKGAVNGLAVSGDGTLVATGDSKDMMLLWNPLTGEVAHEVTMKYDLSRPPPGTRERMSGVGEKDVKRPGGVTALAFSKSGRTIAAGYVDRGIRFWSTKTGKRWDSVYHRERVTALEFAPDGGTFASGGRDGVIHVWEFKEPEKDPTVDEDDAGAAEKKDK
jgi:WD40 repeat protein